MRFLLFHIKLRYITLRHQVSESAETFRKFRTTLGSTVDSYNNIRKTTRQVEFDLIELEVARIDSLISRGEDELCWRSDGLPEYIAELGDLVEGLWKRMKSAQSNVQKIRNILEPWTRTPLIERKDRRKDALLALEDRSEKVSKRYAEITKAAEQIHSILDENKTLFQISETEEEAWQEYVRYIDDIVIESLRKAIGCSLGSYLFSRIQRNLIRIPNNEIRMMKLYCISYIYETSKLVHAFNYYLFYENN